MDGKIYVKVSYEEKKNKNCISSPRSDSNSYSKRFGKDLTPIKKGLLNTNPRETEII
jgi:hypothetical protein